MEHVVFFPAPDSSPAFRRFADLPAAVRFVEHLRNVENVTDASVHALTEVPLAFKAWYRVELPGSPDGSATAGEAPAEVRPTQPAGSAVSGSATGLLVPDQSLVPDQFAASAPVEPSPVPSPEPSPEPSLETSSEAGAPSVDARDLPEPVGVPDVLAPAGRRERGIGFFAR